MPDESTSQDPAEEPSDKPAASDHAAVDAPGEASVEVEPAAEREGFLRGIRLSPAVLVGLFIVPAIVAGVIAWFAAAALAPENKSRLSADVANVLNAFSQSSSSGAVSSRYEGETPPLYPSNIPKYPGAGVVSGVMQVSGEDVSYLVIYDTTASRRTVSDYFNKQLSSGVWQVDASQDGRDSDVRQFTSTDDPNLKGLALVAQSKQDNRTTIVMSVQVTSGAKNLIKQPYSPGDSKPLPDGFPAAVPQYPGSTIIESSFQKQPPSTAFTVTLVTKDDAAKVLDYYRGQLKTGGLTVDAASSAPGATPEASPTAQSDTTVTFTDDKQTIGGQISATPLTEDQSYTRVDLQVTTKSQ